MKCTTVFLWFCFIFRKCPGFGDEIKKCFLLLFTNGYVLVYAARWNEKIVDIYLISALKNDSKI